MRRSSADGVGGVFETVSTLGTQTGPTMVRVDMSPKPIVGSIDPSSLPASPAAQRAFANTIYKLISQSRALTTPGAAAPIVGSILTAIGAGSTLTPDAQAAAVQTILTNSPAVKDKTAIPSLVAAIGAIKGAMPSQPRPRPHGGVVGESIFGGYLFKSDSLPQKMEQPWVSPDKPQPVAATSGFGLSYPVGSRIPATQTRKVHGIFSGLGALLGLGAADPTKVQPYKPVGGYGATPDQSTLANLQAKIAAALAAARSDALTAHRAMLSGFGAFGAPCPPHQTVMPTASGAPGCDNCTPASPLWQSNDTAAGGSCISMATYQAMNAGPAAGGTAASIAQSSGVTDPTLISNAASIAGTSASQAAQQAVAKGASASLVSALATVAGLTALQTYTAGGPDAINAGIAAAAAATPPIPAPVPGVTTAGGASILGAAPNNTMLLVGLGVAAVAIGVVLFSPKKPGAAAAAPAAEAKA